jgi:hypothetical protein
MKEQLSQDFLPYRINICGISTALLPQLVDRYYTVHPASPTSLLQATCFRRGVPVTHSAASVLILLL